MSGKQANVQQRLIPQSVAYILLGVNEITVCRNFHILIVNIFIYFLKDFTYLRLVRQEGREKERERNISQLPLTRPQLGTWLATQACALSGNRTNEPLVRRLALNPLSHRSQGFL